MGLNIFGYVAYDMYTVACYDCQTSTGVFTHHASAGEREA
jgi:hypothetical protein